MKQFLFLSIAFVSTIAAGAQDLKTFRIYRPDEDAREGIRKAVVTAKKENKHVLVQIGGNWCIWCARFYQFTKTDPVADSIIKSAYVVYHLNYSKENKNLPVLADYSYPQRFGFPVFLVLDKEGKLLHTQNSGYLEEGKGYSKDKVADFLSNWTPDALDPQKYKE
ncbi:thioredoxin family protein [Niabella beijingensis]|uniref:thioredoxin family protein n=1 Tax=Niabella beijingensis TaxID=2872700 RepID=UPI001CC07BF1|nr:thioredoxin family protein [Niabella beijingensis]MBZ4192345.1 thioredoxin family protein [Niabella beijingensis]